MPHKNDCNKLEKYHFWTNSLIYILLLSCFQIKAIKVFILLVASFSIWPWLTISEVACDYTGTYFERKRKCLWSEITPIFFISTISEMLMEIPWLLPLIEKTSSSDGSTLVKCITNLSFLSSSYVFSFLCPNFTAFFPLYWTLISS